MSVCSGMHIMRRDLERGEGDAWRRREGGREGGRVASCDSKL